MNATPFELASLAVQLSGGNPPNDTHFLAAHRALLDAASWMNPPQPEPEPPPAKPIFPGSDSIHPPDPFPEKGISLEQFLRSVHGDPNPSRRRAAWNNFVKTSPFAIGLGWHQKMDFSQFGIPNLGSFWKLAEAFAPFCPRLAGTRQPPRQPRTTGGQFRKNTKFTPGTQGIPRKRSKKK